MTIIDVAADKNALMAIVNLSPLRLSVNKSIKNLIVTNINIIKTEITINFAKTPLLNNYNFSTSPSLPLHHNFTLKEKR